MMVKLKRVDIFQTKEVDQVFHDAPRPFQTEGTTCSHPLDNVFGNIAFFYFMITLVLTG